MKFLLILISIFVSTNGVIIQCNYHNITWSDSIGVTYSCDGIIVSYGNSSIVTEIQGRHSVGKSNADVKGFFINYDQVMNMIPQGIEQFFPHLLAFQWYYGNLTTLTVADLQPFPNLKHIFFGWNRIVSIDGDLFQSTRNLTHIYLNNNLIQHVGFNLLTYLNELKTVDFRVNNCTNSFADNSAAIQEMNFQLPLSCPPLPPSTTSMPTTTTISTCDIRCSINDETDELKRIVADLQGRIEELEKRERNLDSMN